MPVNKKNCRKADLYAYIGERSKDLIVGSGILDCVTVSRCSSNSAELRETNPSFVTEGDSYSEKSYSKMQPLYSQGNDSNMPCVLV